MPDARSRHVDFKALTPRTIRPDPMIARNLVGYGEAPPDPRWPGGARIAVNFNLNVEGGGEATVANGDPASEGMLNDIGVPIKTGQALMRRQQSKRLLAQNKG